MSAVVRRSPETFYPDEMCAICQDSFTPEEERLSHENATHDGFHRQCLETWISRNPSCPIDRRAFAPSLIMSWATHKVIRPRPVVINAAYCMAVLQEGITLLVQGGAAGIVVRVAQVAGVPEIVARVAAVATAIATRAGIDWALRRRNTHMIPRYYVINAT